MSGYGRHRQVGCNVPMCQQCEAIRIDIIIKNARAEGEEAGREQAETLLSRHGFRRCDIAACNCGSWHTGPNLRAEALQAEVEVLRGVDCMADGDGPCGVCLKCARAQAFDEAARKFREHFPNQTARSLAFLRALAKEKP